MAFYQDNEEEDQNQNNTQAPTGPEGSGLISGSGSGAPAPGPAQQKAPDHSGNFAGIQQYLAANKNQAAKLGDQTAGIINNSANQARQSVGALNQEAQDKVKGVNSLDSGVSQRLQNNAEDLSQDERGMIKKTASAQYGGPKAAADLSGYQAAADATQKATTTLGNVGSEEGRMNLISQVNNKPRTQGINIFDNALLQAGSGREKLNQAAAANQDVKGGLDAASQAIQGQIGRADDPNTPDVDESAGAIGQTNKAQADASKQIQDALSAWKTGFQPKVGQAQQQLIDFQNKINNDLGDNAYSLDNEDLDAFGLAPGQRLYGLNLSDYLNQVSPSDINAGNVASGQDYARYGALSDLAGETNGILNPANASMAGTAPSASGVINRDKLLEDQRQKEAAFNNLAANTSLSATGAGGYGASASARQLISDYINGGADNQLYTNANQDPSQIQGHESYPAIQEATNAAKNALAQKIQDWLEQNKYNTAISANDQHPIELPGTRHPKL